MMGDENVCKQSEDYNLKEDRCMVVECKRCRYYDPEDDYCTAFVCNGLECPQLPCER